MRAAPSIQAQAGWRRVHPAQLCQGADILLRVTEYDFDLSDSAFQDYAARRGVLYLAGVKGSPRWQFTSDFSKGKTEFMADPYFQFAQEWPDGSGERVRFDAAQMATQWTCMCLARARLQDAWELFKTISPRK